MTRCGFASGGSEQALLIEVDDLAAATALHEWVRAVDALPAARDVVPAARSVLLDGVDPAAWRELLRGQEIRRIAQPSGDEIVIPVYYDGADLDVVAEQWGCTTAEVVDRHRSIEFVVAFCGFAPGFAYCTPRQPLPLVSRRADPRPEVPAGSVALAAEFCGLYPTAMPGGWQLIGRTDETLFDPSRTKPALLQAGDRVRFEVVS